MKLGLVNFLACFFVAIIMSPFIIRRLRKLKFGQSILVYVEQHKLKSGTPTMGGVIIVLSTIAGYLIFWKPDNILATISILSLLFFGVLGFLDDFIKIKFKHNEGLKPYQKVIGQVGLSLIISIFIYNSNLVGTKIILPFSSIELEMGFWIIPFVVIFYLAVVNSVNLIDGLDGLCGGVSTVVLLAFAIITSIISNAFDMVYLNEMNNIILVTLGLAGAILGFLCFNSYPARVFMGDTGSLAIGGFMASVFGLTRQYLLIVLVGVAYVITSISVIMQVVSYKLTKKRIFKMTPIHHHFESVAHEAKVSMIYIILTIAISILTIILYI